MTYACDWNLLPMSPRQHSGRGKILFMIWRQKTQTINYSLSLTMKLKGSILAFGAGRFHLCFINRTAGRFYPCTTIGRLYASGNQLKGFILTLSMDKLESFIFTLLLEAIGRKREDGRACLSCDWYLATPKVARPRNFCIQKKLYCLTKSVYLGVSTSISKAKGYRCWSRRSGNSSKSKSRRSKIWTSKIRKIKKIQSLN